MNARWLFPPHLSFEMHWGTHEGFFLWFPRFINRVSVLGCVIIALNKQSAAELHCVLSVVVVEGGRGCPERRKGPSGHAGSVSQIFFSLEQCSALRDAGGLQKRVPVPMAQNEHTECVQNERLHADLAQCLCLLHGVVLISRKPEEVFCPMEFLYGSFYGDGQWWVGIYVTLQHLGRILLYFCSLPFVVIYK